MVDSKPDAGPDPDSFQSVFQVYSVEEDGSTLRYLGDPLASQDEIIEEVWPLFREHGYEVSLEWENGDFVLIANPVQKHQDGLPWMNIILFGLTILTTLYAGAGWFYVRDIFSPAIIKALPFTIGVLAVLGTHELGHYVMSRYHNVNATLPYFIPMAPPFGTMGAVIRMKGQIPSRKALFDIGVAGPIAGLIMTVIVTIIGLKLPPVHIPPWVFQGPSITIEFGYPPLLQFLAWAVNEPLAYPNQKYLVVNPVVLAGWIGMFVTFLNLIPVGQLDGGHILRAIIGPRQESVAPLVPLALFGLSAYLRFIRNIGNAAGIWIFWGLLTLIFSYVGSATPIQDDAIDTKRIIIGIVTFIIGALCFTPVPVQIGV